jgi:hypothetical protein
VVDVVEVLPEGVWMNGNALLTVTYTGEPDVVHEFTADGQRRTFGRSESCDIVIWSAINGVRLSALAGVVWRMDGELWLRNLSTVHDLYLEVPGMPPDPPLPPRPDRQARGAARSITGDLAFVRGPDGCDLRIRQVIPPTADLAATDAAGLTARVPRIPRDLRRVALALCEPLFRGSQLPASYTQICARTGISSRKTVRNQVERLTALYFDEVPALRELVQARLDKEAARLGLAAAPMVRGGIVRFDPAEAELVDVAEAERRAALALPTYYEVAHLLVRRRVVREADLPQLDEGSA